MWLSRLMLWGVETIIHKPTLLCLSEGMWLMNDGMASLFPSVDDALEVIYFQRCATNEATVDIWLSEEFRSVRCFA